MDRKQPPWERVNGVQGLWLYKGPAHGDWPQDVNKPDLHPDWPRILLLDLTAQQFDEFDDNPLGFTNRYKLFPDKPVRWMSYCAKPPLGQGIALVAEASRWTVAIIHSTRSIATCAAIPQTDEADQPLAAVANQKQPGNEPPWEIVNGVRGLWLYKGPSHPVWPQDVNKPDLHPDWPRILLLDLTARQFDEFDDDPLRFANDHRLFPDRPVRWMSPCAKPPLGKTIPVAKQGSRWTVGILHKTASKASCAAIPQELERRK
jgi:hypothetical protein